MQRTSRDVAVAVFVIFCSLLTIGVLFISIKTDAALGIPCSNPHIATSEDIAAGYPAGSYVCPQDYQLSNVTPESGAAKEYLKSLPRQSVGGSICAPPGSDENIDRLNSTFATCAARFLKEYTSRYGGIVITSAYRDGTPGSSPKGDGKSANQCAGGAPGSNHQRGLAMDVYPSNGDFEQIWNFASQNPQFGICFPYKGGDRPHMALAGTGTGEAAKCATQGVSQSCSGTKFDPNSIQQVASTPTTSWSDKLREWLNPQLTQPTVQNCVLPDGLVVPCNSIANQGNITYPNNANLGTSPQQPFSASQQPAQYQQQQTPPSTQQSPTSQMLFSIPEQNVASSTKSIALTLRELLDLYAATSTSIATTTSVVAVVIGGREVATLQSSTSTSSILFQAENIYVLSPPVGQVTFTSPDLQGNSLSSLTPSQYQHGTYQRVLADLKSVVLRLLEYLGSFGRPTYEGDGVQ